MATTCDKDRFAHGLIRELRKTGIGWDVDYDQSKFRINFVLNGTKRVFNLGNKYRDYTKLSGAGQRRHLKRIVRAMVTPYTVTQDFELARGHLLPKLLDRTPIEVARMCGDDDVQVPHRLVGDHLVATVYYDYPDSMRGVRQAELEGWGVSFEQAMEIALGNLRQLDSEMTHVAPGVYRCVWTDNYEASRLLLPEVFRKLDLDGDPIVVVPNRDTLLAAGSDDAAGLTILAHLAEKALQESRPINPMPVRVVGDTFTSWMPEPDSPAFPRFCDIQRGFLHERCNVQTKVLDALFEKRNDGPFVAPHMLLTLPSGEASSVAVWTKGVDTLLPKTDKLGFMDLENDSATSVSWDKAEEVVGHLITPAEGFYPPRYLVKEFPSAEQLQAMGNEFPSN